jgi:two-component system, chemotaxis family, protein-glutamate methylesterase/glutaminase
VYGAHTLAVILTGMGQDGVKECDALRRLGARIYVQDEATSVVWGMPGLVARAGLADKILPLDQIGFEIVRANTMQIAARTQA